MQIIRSSKRRTTNTLGLRILFTHVAFIDRNLKRAFCFFSILLDRAQNAMRLPNYPRLDKIPLPLHLQRARNAGKKARLQSSSPGSQQEKTVIVN